MAITGLGAVSAVGHGVPALWAALAEGRDGIRPIERFSTEGFSVQNAALVPDTQSDPTGTADLALEFAIEAGREALVSSGLAGATGTLGGGESGARVAIVFGTSLATHVEGIHRLAELMGEALGASGPRLTVSTACSSSANAVGIGRDWLLEGAADVVIAGGSDALTGEIFAGFHNLGLLAPDRCAPFSAPPGTTLGEGAGFLVLERAEDAERRSAKVIAWVSGMGLSCDAYHATSPDPAGGGIARAARAALADAGLSPGDIDYVNAHGTGTEANDPAEFRGLTQALGERAQAIPVSATKSVIGHGQGAAGVLEIIATLVAMQRGRVPQTLHHTRPRPRCPPDPVAQKEPRPHAVAHALCDSSAFGGANALITLDAPDRSAPGRRVPRRAVSILGVAGILPGISEVASLAEMVLGETMGPGGSALSAGAGDLDSGGRPKAVVGPGALRGRVAQGPAPKSVAGVDLRGFDPLSRLLTFATAEALRDAEVSLRGPIRDRAGLFAGLKRISPASAHELDGSVKERGLLRLSAPAFTRVVLNASTGAAARSLQLRGPTTTITTGDGSGLAALVLACDHLSLRDDADLIAVASADEVGPDEAPESLCEAGACVVLGSGAVSSREPVVRVAGWGLAGPGGVGQAISRALAMAGIDSEQAPSLTPSLALAAPSASVLIDVAVAAHRLHAGAHDSVLIAHDNKSIATAVVLQRMAP